MLTRTLCAALWTIGTSTACSSNSSPPSHDGSPDGGGATTDQIKILSLSTTVSTITGGQPMATESDSVTFVAIVTDTKGLDTIAGGQLVNGTGATYAAFEAGTNKGTYTAMLTFQRMNQTTALDFPDAGGMITLTAKFFDNDASVATASLPLHLACRDSSNGLMGACGGGCTDPSIDYAHCGTCGTACGNGLHCASGTCRPAVIDVNNDTSCIAARSIDPGLSCADVCTAAGKNCSGAQLWDDASCANSVSYYACGTTLKDTLNSSFKGLVCVCSD